MSYVPPKPVYDISYNEYSKWNFPQSVGNLAGEAPALAPRFGVQYPGGGEPMPNFSTAGAFQAPASVEGTSSAGSSAALSAFSSQPMPSGSSAPSSIPSSQDLLFQPQGVGLPVSADAQAAPASRRTRGPNRRRPGTSNFDMMDGLPKEAQIALQQEYVGCCEVVKGKDLSAVQKHRFTKRHFQKLDSRFHGLFPAFTCPAFVLQHAKCTSAKAGRYDSTERHCANCAGFQELSAADENITLYPLAVNQEEFDAVRQYRKPTKSNRNAEPPALVGVLVFRVITTMFGPIRLPESTSESPESESADAPIAEDAAPTGEPSTPSPSPSDPSPSSEPHPVVPFAGPSNDVAGDQGEAIPQVTAPASWLDAFAPAPLPQEEHSMQGLAGPMYDFAGNGEAAVPPTTSWLDAFAPPPQEGFLRGLGADPIYDFAGDGGLGGAPAPATTFGTFDDDAFAPAPLQEDPAFGSLYYPTDSSTTWSDANFDPVTFDSFF